MIDTEAVKRELHSQMLRLFDNVGSASAAAGGPYWPRRYLQMVRTHGGLAAAQRWLARRDRPTGFDRLQKLGLLNLSVEALVLQPRFRVLFTPQEIAAARRRLENAGYVAP